MAGLALAMGLASAAWAQPLGPEALTAHRLLQLARWTMSEPEAAHPSRVAVGAALLRHATALDPTQAELWRVRAEAEHLAGDRQGVRLCLGEYLKIEPRDDAAQLRLIEMLIEDQQTAGDRLTICKRLLEGAGAAQLSAALRSRVALHAAMLHSELGDLRGYAEQLKAALSLDNTNIQAAQQAHQFLVHRGAGRLEQAQALFNWVSADPSQADNHLAVARMLLEAGQYDRAAGWYDSANRIWAENGGVSSQMMSPVVADWALCFWAMGRSADALKLIAHLSVSPPGQPPPEPSTELQSILAAIHLSDGRLAEAAAEADKLLGTLNRRLESPGAGPQHIADLLWAQLLFNRAIDQSPGVLDRLSSTGAVDPAVVQRLRGWMLMRQGNKEEARAALEPIAAADPAAEMALALLEDPASPAQRIARLNRVAVNAPATILGVMAVQMMAAAQARPQWNETALNIARLEGQIHPRVKKVSTPGQYLVMRIRPVKPAFAWNEPIELEVELMNVSGAPLGLGKGRTAPSTVLFVVGATAGRKPLPGPVMHVLDMERRLRLEPGASVAVRTRIDANHLGLMLTVVANSNIDLRATAILNPVMAPNGVTTGILGATQLVRDITRPGWTSTNANLIQLVQAAEGPDTAAAVHAATLMACLVPLTKIEGLSAAQVTAAKLAGAYDKLPRSGKAAVLAHLNPSTRSEKMFEPITTSAINSGDELLVHLLLTQFVRQPDSPLLNAALRSEPGPIRDFAQHFRKVLELNRTLPQQPPLEPEP
jgi:tetratricopeptide (TPR) repeat protein